MGSLMGFRFWMMLAIGVSLMAMSAWISWKWQSNHYRSELLGQAAVYQRERENSALAVIEWQEAEKGRRKALEGDLRVIDEAHFKEFSDAQKNISKLRDRLATADLRLSVLLAEDSASGCSVSAGTNAGGMVHGGARARLDPAHAQRIISITDAGDQGLIALEACQAYVREVTRRQ